MDASPGQAPAHEGPPSSPSPAVASVSASLGSIPDDDEYIPELDDFVPVPRRSNRHDGWSEAAQREFIRVLSLIGNVTVAARAVGKTRVTAYRLRKCEGAEGFARAWDIAEDMGRQHIRDLAYLRAVEGEQRPVFRGGKLVGYRTVYDNRLLMRFMQVSKPETYNKQHHYPGAPVPQALHAAYAALGGVDAVDAMLKQLDRDLTRVEKAMAEGTPLPPPILSRHR